MNKDVMTNDTSNRGVDTHNDGTHRDDSRPRRPRIYPAYEVWEDKGSIHLRLEMPGLERDDVSITVETNKLLITGSRPDWTVDGTVLLRERRVGDYYREFTLDKTVDTDSINAVMKDGVLEITLGLAKEAQPKRIQIKTG
jgi:HSP20 family protein